MSPWANLIVIDSTSQERADMYRETPEYQAKQQALKDAQQAALREQSQQDFRAGERAELPSAPAPKKEVPWYQKAWNAVTTTASAVTTTVVNAIPAPVKTFVQEKIVEPVKTYIVEPVKKYVIEPIKTYVIEPIKKYVVEPIKKYVVEPIKKYVIEPIKTYVVEPIKKYVVEPIKRFVTEKIAQIKKALQDIWDKLKNAAQNLWDNIKEAFRTNPFVAWGTSLLTTALTLAGGYYYVNCVAGQGAPVSTLINFAGVSMLPATGLLTTGKKQRLHGLLVGMMLFGMLLSACAPGNAPSTPTNPADTPTPISTCTNTPTSVSPTITVTPNLKSSVELYKLATYLYSIGWAQCAPELQNSPDCLALQTAWTDQYSQIIMNVANDPSSEWRLKYPDLNIDPLLLAVLYKRIVLNETQFVPGVVTGKEQGAGFAQVTPDTLRRLLDNGLITLPEGVSRDDDAAIVALLVNNPDFNAKAGMANLVWLYQGVIESNESNGWQMKDETVWKLVAAQYNAGPESNSLVVSVGSDFDYWEGIRHIMETHPDWAEGGLYSCPDPNNWECLQIAIRVYIPVEKETGILNADGTYTLVRGGKCTVEYAESVVPDGITSNPTSVLNEPVRPECKQ